MADVIYNSVKKDLLDGAIDFANDTIKLALVTSSYTPNQDTHNFFDDITNEVVGAGYTADGATIANPANTQDDTDNEGVFDGDDVTWTSSTITAAGGILYKSTGTDSTSPLIAFLDFGGDIVSDNGTFTVTVNAEGLLNIG